MELANRLNRITEPQTIKMAKLGRELRAKGINIVDLSLGEPDFATPKHICDAAVKAMAEGYTKYPPVAGYPDLLKAISDKLQRDNHLDYSTEEIIVSTGAKQSLANAVLSIVNPGDEVIIPTPYWVTYSAQVMLAEGEVKFIHCGIDSDYKLTPEKLEAAITPKTKLFMYSSPCNPTGSIYSKKELQGLTEVFKKHPNIFIISDEIYEYINYVGSHESIAQFPELRDRVIVVNGMSKGFAMTGWRLGYMAAPKAIARACEKLQGQITSGANSIAQRAAIAALTGSLDDTHKMKKAFQERRDFIIPALQEMKGVKVNVPDGAFYAFPDISSFFGKTDGTTTIKNDEDIAMYLLHEGHVSTVAGSAFNENNCIRISFANSMNNIKEAMERMCKTLGKLK
jgi:aspartate aminotransferase